VAHILYRLMILTVSLFAATTPYNQRNLHIMTSSVERHGTTRRMSKIVIHNDTVYLCGQVGNRGDTIEAQCHEALSRVDALLNEAGSSKENMLQVIVWLKTMDDFDAMNKIWEAWVPEGCAPARACGRAELASGQLLVEFTVTAAK
jgi:enamine deaminase RidA (YjgF/YER057c/UK114 family)